MATPTLAYVAQGLKNTDTAAVAVSFTASPGLYLVLVESQSAYAERHPAFTPSWTSGGGLFTAAPSSVVRADGDNLDLWATTLELFQVTATGSGSATLSVAQSLPNTYNVLNVSIWSVADGTVGQSAQDSSQSGQSNVSTERTYTLGAAPAASSLLVAWTISNEDSGSGSMAAHSGWTEAAETWDSFNIRRHTATITGTTATSCYVPANAASYGNWSAVAVELTETVPPSSVMLSTEAGAILVTEDGIPLAT